MLGFCYLDLSMDFSALALHQLWQGIQQSQRLRIEITDNSDMMHSFVRDNGF